MDWMSDSIDNFLFHQFGAICGEQQVIVLFPWQNITNGLFIHNRYVFNETLCKYMYKYAPLDKLQNGRFLDH